MASIQIDRGIPVPPPLFKKGERKYPFELMQVGDSFLVALEGRRSWSFIYQAIKHAQDKQLGKFSTRLLENGDRRVWRVA